MRIENNKDEPFLTFRDIEIGTPFYSDESSDGTLYMKTEDIHREVDMKSTVFINAVKILDGTFVLFGEYSRVKVANVHVENDKG